MYRVCLVVFAVIFCLCVNAQPPEGMHWNKAGDAFYQVEDGGINLYQLPSFIKKTVVSAGMLTPMDTERPLDIYNFFFSADDSKALIYTNTKKVWRYNTRGDYWVIDLKTKKLRQLGKGLPESSLMFAKLSPDGTKAAYVSMYNIYTEDIVSGKINQLTFDGTRKYINGTFDWAYEEEFFCRDGFRWSPDSKKIVYWNIDARKTKDYLMIDNTDSIYPFVKPVEYPIAGEPPSPFKIGVVDIATAKTTWMNIPTDSILQSYVTRMEWAANSDELIIQHLSRRQNVSDVMLCNVHTGTSASIYHEEDPAWIDVIAIWDQAYSYGGWDWFNNGKEFLWASEKDGWRHLYRISRDGKTEKLITIGNYDVMNIDAIDEASGYVYFDASPTNATQKYLYRARLDGSAEAERLSPANQEGTHEYEVSPTGKYATHSFSNYYTPPVKEWVSLPSHKSIDGDNVNRVVASSDKSKSNIRYFTVKTQEGIEMDAWMVKPNHFDSTKKYPVVFYVYTEPWGQNVIDEYGATDNFLYNGNMADDGYIYISIDNRGVILPKGREWRKCIDHKIGQLNISDQAMAAREILKWPFIDTSRVAVWGWSGGGSATLNLLFQYPDIYKTGIAVAAEGNQFTYDNIYQERYMGLPQEYHDAYVKGSPITYAKNLQGHLLYIHGTGDDNVHYNNAEMLLNALIKYNKIFQFMAYPNRTHGIFEGEGTQEHLSNLYTTFLKQYCPPGGR
ncbi:MAG TPA: DPP IV N-terminal domain-containing protein [Chitinophagaceae bacterium]|nr:DPP IV N-terminal domain-containing protein [Chitinophagaceae bacterium]